MKIKTNELTGSALDWAAGVCALLDAPGGVLKLDLGAILITLPAASFKYDVPGHWKPSTDWSQGGPIIEQEKMHVYFDPECIWVSVPPSPVWVAWRNEGGMARWCGPTFLVAAMRCYVASRLGDEVDVPETLL